LPVSGIDPPISMYSGPGGKVGAAVTSTTGGASVGAAVGAGVGVAQLARSMTRTMANENHATERFVLTALPPCLGRSVFNG
jgi:hypothetical protein